MSTVAVIIIIVVVLVALALIYSAMRRKQTERHLEDRRQVASAHRQEAGAREREAQEAQAAAEAHSEYARDVDPDAETAERREPPRP
jgi:F0F1-type ATP synthase membrane subunit b/b'